MARRAQARPSSCALGAAVTLTRLVGLLLATLLLGPLGLIAAVLWIGMVSLPRDRRRALLPRPEPRLLVALGHRAGRLVRRIRAWLAA